MIKFRFALVLIIPLLFSKICFADLLIAPQRIFFEQRDRVKEMTLLNTSSSTKTFRIEWVEQTQTKDGQYRILDLDESIPGLHSASEFLRFSPRQVRLKAGESQTIKIIARRKSTMPASELRSHIKFKALSTANMNDDTSTPGVKLRLEALTSFVVPILLRNDESNVNISIESAMVEVPKNGASYFANAVINWSKVGGFSVVGQMSIWFKSINESEFTEIGFLNGVNFFAERQKLTTMIPLSKSPSSKRGTLKIKFIGDYTNANEILAEKNFDVVLP